MRTHLQKGKIIFSEGMKANKQACRYSAFLKKNFCPLPPNQFFKYKFLIPWAMLSARCEENQD